MVGLNLLHSSEAASPKSSKHALELLALARRADNDVAANFFLGWLAKNGDSESVPLCREKASEYFQLAIDASAGVNVPALFHLSGLLSEDGREREAVALLEQAVEGSADLSCKCCLANTLSWGAPGVPEDAARAKSLYEHVIEAARDGSTIKADAIWGLACLVQEGAPGVGAPDEETATLLFGQLVEDWNDIQAMVELGEMAASSRDLERAYWLYQRASEAEGVSGRDKKYQSEAIFNMGAMICRGQGPFPRDKPRAFHLFEKAFALGHAGALTRLAGMHDSGVKDMAGNVVVEADEEKAKEMYSQAMEEYSDPDAMSCLAHILFSDDKVRVSKIYQRLIDEFEDSDAMTSLGLMYERGDDCYPRDGSFPQDAVKAVELYERAIALGNTEAMYYLDLYRTGVGTVQADLSRAVEVFKAAAELGEWRSMIAGGNLLALGGPGLAPDTDKTEALFRQYLEDESDSCGASEVRVKLARLLYRCGKGLSKRRQEAMGLLKTEIATKYDGDYKSLAFQKLASIYEAGDKDVTKDVTLSISYYRQAIALHGYGRNLSTIRLAMLLEREGMHGEEDLRRAESLGKEKILAVATALENADEELESDPPLAQQLRARAQAL